jgi:DNA-binding NtrC family response regulator
VSQYGEVQEGLPVGKVLLAEDEPALARVYARALLAMGVQAEHQPNGALALRRILVEDFDVLVSDVRMPQMSGLELLREVRLRRPDMPVVLLTAHLDAEQYGEARDLGTVRYLLKPVGMDQFARAVQSALQLRAVWRRRSARRAEVG